jgi:type I restriction enzyme S subunit
MSWSPVKLGSCIDFQNGYAFKSKFFVTDTTQYALIKGENLGKGFIHWNKTKYWQIEQISGLEKFFINANDILLAMDRPYVSGGLKYTMVKEDELPLLQVQRIGRLTAKKEKITPHFLKAVIGSPFFLHYIKNLQGGVGVPHISPKQIKSYEFLLPAKSIQKKIASILSTYDDLIENNLKRIKLLEEAAQNVYKEWFVHFRFPEHEKVKMDKEIGLPEGWEKKPFSEEVLIKPKTIPIKDKVAPYVPMASISTSQMVIENVEERIPKGGAKFKNGDTLFARITPCLENGKTGYVQFLEHDEIVATGSTEFIVFREKDRLSRYTIYLIARTFDFRENAIKSMSGSDGRQRVKEEAFDKFLIPIATENVREKFDRIVAAKFELIHQLSMQNAKLKEARDILLPRLMNQTIRV